MLTARSGLDARLALTATLALLLLPLPARALEFFDGDVQIHGFGEVQVRAIQDDFDPDNKLDLTQWYWVLNLEAELDLIKDGWGPINEISGFVRAEVRYDCVWTRGCGTMRSADTYGDRAKRLPERLSDSRKNGFIGTRDPEPYSDKRPRILIPYGQRGDEYAVPESLAGFNTDPPTPVPGQRHLGRLWNVVGLGELFFVGSGADGVFDDPDHPHDDPGLFILQEFTDYRFGLARTEGTTGGNGTRVFGPWRPKDDVPNMTALNDYPNPYRVEDYNPYLRVRGAGELPFRPAPLFAWNDETAPDDQARGLYYPNAGVAPLADRDRFGVKDQNFSQTRLEWNQGASQGQTRELKEAYLDIDLFNYRLWLRLGKQTIVWGKTELFRAQDQFNPQDLGLASLPSLEESRIGLWAARVIYSFYDIGPFQDVRLEGALNFDEFQPTDIGRCGEPYAPPAACTKSLGHMGFALTGTGVAGEFRPEKPWNDSSGLEGGVRLEFRMSRFSFAITDFYGYDDLPYLDQLFVYERNVDPMTGRPRRAGSRDPCDPEGLYTNGDTSGCLGAVRSDGTVADNAFTKADVLANHHANQQLFTTICAATVGFSSDQPESCAFNLWNSTELALPDLAQSPRFSTAFSSMLSGQGYLNRLAAGTGVFGSVINGKAVLLGVGEFENGIGAIGSSSFAGAQDEDDLPLVPIRLDPGDADNALGFATLAAYDPTLTNQEIFIWVAWANTGLAPFLSDEQEALLGCGEYWGTDCDLHGFDLFNAEASVILQSFPGFEGSDGVGTWDTFEQGVQPGTIPFFDPFFDPDPGSGDNPYGPDPYVCTRFVDDAKLQLPGCLSGSVGSMSLNVNAQLERTTPVDSAGAMPFGTPFSWPADGREYCVFRFVLNEADLCNKWYVDNGFADKTDVEFRAFQAQFGRHPFTGDPWASELAAVSFNLLMVLTTLSLPSAEMDEDGFFEGELDENGVFIGSIVRFDEFDPRDAYNPDKCSYRNPLVCKSVSALMFVSQPQRNTVNAGGNARFGRRDFVWHGGSVVGLRYNKRNTLGFSMDVAEDWTKANYSAEFTWFDDVKAVDFDEQDGISSVDQFNLVLSVDRPTFIRFLNPARTFFFNAQMFVQYVDGYRKSFSSNGPWNLRWTFSVSTGYFQDRLLPSLTAVWDRRSSSGALLPRISYRITQSFSVQLGMGFFWGRTQRKSAPLVPIGIQANGAGQGSYHSYVENGLSSIRDRDEIFLRIRYTF